MKYLAPEMEKVLLTPRTMVICASGENLVNRTYGYNTDQTVNPDESTSNFWD